MFDDDEVLDHVLAAAANQIAMERGFDFGDGEEFDAPTTPDDELDLADVADEDQPTLMADTKPAPRGPSWVPLGPNTSIPSPVKPETKKDALPTFHNKPKHYTWPTDGAK